jgi:hypothetical protein
MTRPTTGLSDNVRALMKKGVKILNPLSVDIGSEVNPDRISHDDVTIYPGTRLYGEKTLISRGSRVGYESPATVDDCLLGPHVELRGGFLKSSVFLEKAVIAGGAQVREGCILEEEASAAHSVGLKQTILFPFVTLGSLINFCDCFMAGGTSRKDHSEVGSSYIHFNYTPNQDKATPSLIGDVPRGVMLNRPPIFLGGQGGLIGPARIGYGTLIPAGVIYRKDCPEGGKRLTEESGRAISKPFHIGFYGDIHRRVCNNIIYLANLLALRQWYCHIRRPFFQLDDMGEELYLGAMDALECLIRERLKRFQELSEKMERSVELGEKLLKGDRKKMLLNQKKEFHRSWPALKDCFTKRMEETIALAKRDRFVKIIHAKISRRNPHYLKAIKGLTEEESLAGTQWLQNIVDHITESAGSCLPSIRM